MIVKSITGHRPKFNVLTFTRHRFKLITDKLLQYFTRQTVGFKQLWRPLVILNKSDKMKTPTVLPTADYWICLYWKHRDDEFYILSKSGFIKNQTVIYNLMNRCMFLYDCLQLITDFFQTQYLRTFYIAWTSLVAKEFN